MAAKKAGEKSTEKKKATTKSSTKSVKTKRTVSVSAKAEGAEPKPRVGRMNGRACKIKSCKREYRAKGYCAMHYKKWRKGAFGRARYKTCGDVTCFKPMAMNRHGYCEEHFQNYYVKGMEVVRVPAAAPAEEEKAAG
jgi:hypothetical protein